jgi:ketosteroid isomerase-like protein
MAVTLDIADALFGAIERGDTAAVDALWCDDITVWHSGDTRDSDRARALKVIRWFVDRTTQRRYEILDRVAFDGGFVQQHVLHATATDGAVIAMRVCIIVRISTSRITRIDEYFDPAEMAPLLVAG